MVNQYETVFIMTPVLSEEQIKETVIKFRKYLTDNGAEMVLEDSWGMRKLAYPIQKNPQDFITFSSSKLKALSSGILRLTLNVMSGLCAS